MALVYSVGLDGLTVPTQAELLAYYQAQFLDIYGVDLSTQDASSPDNQLVNILIQSDLDLQDLVTQVYNSFDPDNAIGVVLDQRVAINGIQREAGTYSTSDVTLTVVTSTSVNLYGLDQTAQPVFTVQDAAGNQWQLLFTVTGVTSGSYSYAFQASTPGANLTTPGTITLPVTIVLGVTAINNPSAQTYVGVNEESDMELHIRRQKSTAISSQGYYDGLLAALENVTGVTYANLIENDTSSTIGSGPNTGLPGHSIWAIIAASNESSTTVQAAIAQAIYAKRNAGCGMYSQNGTTYTVVRPNGNSIVISWDWVVPVPVYLTMNVLSIDGIHIPNISAILSGISDSFDPGVSETITANQISALIGSIDSNAFLQNIGFSTGIVQTIYFTAAPSAGTFKLSYNGTLTATINYNDSTASIQSKLRTLTGDASLTVGGTIGAQTLTVTFVSVTAPLLIGQSATNLDSGATKINFLTNYSSLLPVSSSLKQFTLSEADIVTTATTLKMFLTALGVTYTFTSGVVTGSTVSIVHAHTLQFTGKGGYSTYVYSVSSSTGGAINSSSGLYTAGTAGTDTVTVTDVLGNTATCTVTVT